MAQSYFGRDTSCTTSRRTGRFVRGARLVGEAAFRRLTTPRGMLRGGADEAEYGLDVTSLVGTVNTTSDAAALGGRVSSELTKDERIISADVEVLSFTEGPSRTLQITVDALTTEGPFTLQVGVDEVSAQLLRLEAEG
jgi:hypothetical protein